MRNRIGHLVPQALSVTEALSHAELCHRPTLTLHADRPITVDMERFFEFSFSFAEELLDLEEKFKPQTSVVSLERELAVREAEVMREAASQSDQYDFDVDARWM